MRPSRHSRGRGYNPRLMSSIWCAPQAPSCQTHIYTLLKAAPEKSRPIKNGHHMHSVMLAIVHSYKLDWKNKFSLWCELGWFLQRQSHMVIMCMYDAIVIKIILQSPHGVRSCCKATSYRSVANSKSFTMNLCKPPDPLSLTGNIAQNW